jgi:hypothetical protein
MGRGQVIAKYLLRAITQAPHARAIIALLAAVPAVLIDAIFRFSGYRDLPPLLPVAALSFSNPHVFLYTIPYALVLSILVLVPSRSTLLKSLGLSLLPVFYILASNYALFLHAAEGNFLLNPLTSFLLNGYLRATTPITPTNGILT